jgi:hypothetical protein
MNYKKNIKEESSSHFASEIGSIRNYLLLNDLKSAYKEIMNLKDKNLIPVELFNYLFYSLIKKIEEEDMVKKTENDFKHMNFILDNELKKEQDRKQDDRKRNDDILYQAYKDLTEHNKNLDDLDRAMQDSILKITNFIEEKILGKDSIVDVKAIAAFKERVLENPESKIKQLGESVEKLKHHEKEIKNQLQSNNSISKDEKKFAEEIKSRLAKERENMEKLQAVARKAMVTRELVAKMDKKRAQKEKVKSSSQSKKPGGSVGRG